MSKEGKGTKGARKGDADIKTQELLQAVIIADTFTKRFRPLTFEKPKALLPLVNLPMIEYTLEFLASAGVQEIFVLCTSFPRDLEAYIRSSRWGSMSMAGAGVRVRTLVSPQCQSVGDALRELDSKQVVRSDFILVFGDLISNMNLAPVLAAHRGRRDKDKQAIMTKVFTRVSLHHSARGSADKDVAVALAKPSDQLIQYVNIHKSRHASIDLDVLTGHQAVQVRYDLLDCNVYICAPEVLMLFTDNFDYEDMETHFLRGLLDEEILGNKVFAHVLDGEYAARVTDLRAYDSVSKNMIQRWTYPIVPDCNISGATTFTYRRGNVYKEIAVDVARSCKLEGDSVVGSGTTIGENTVVRASVIGRNCVIGSNVQLDGAYLWDNVVVQDGARIERSIVANHVRVSAAAHVLAGCVISYKVVIGPNFKVPAGTLLTTSKARDGGGGDDGFGDDDDGFGTDEAVAEVPPSEPDADLGTSLSQTTNTAFVGVGGVGWPYDPAEAAKDEDEEEEDETQIRSVYNLASDEMPHLALLSDEETTDEEVDDEFSDENIIPEEPSVRFAREVKATVMRGVEDNHSMDDTLLEILSLKLASNMSANDCARSVMAPFLEYTEGKKLETAAQNMATLNQVMGKWKALVAKFLRSAPERLEFIRGLEEYCGESKAFGGLFQYVLKLLYDMELLPEETILSWAARAEKATAGSDSSATLSKRFLAQSQQFITWLRTAEEDDDDDDEDEDEEED